MPATRRNRMPMSKTMRGGKKMGNAEAKELKVPEYVQGSLKQIGKAVDIISEVFQAYNPTYYKDFGLAPAKKLASKIYIDLEKLEKLVKKNKYYDRNATSSPM
jgi:hypothetical protein